MPARPYICRLIVFNRLMRPSLGPVLHRSVIAASTAASSRRTPSANRRISGQLNDSPFTNQSLSVPHEHSRSRSANPSAKPNAIDNSSLAARIASIRLCSLSLRSSGRRTHSNDNYLGDGEDGSDGRAGLIRSHFFPAAFQPFPDVSLHAAVRAMETSSCHLPIQVGRVRIPSAIGHRSTPDVRPIGIVMPVPASSAEALCIAGNVALCCATCQASEQSYDPMDPADEVRGLAQTVPSSSSFTPAGLEATAILNFGRSAAEVTAIGQRVRRLRYDPMWE